MKLTASLQKNLNPIKRELSSDDVTFMDFTICGANAVLIFVNDIVDKKAVGELILRPLAETIEETSVKKISETVLVPEKK